MYRVNVNNTETLSYPPLVWAAQNGDMELFKTIYEKLDAPSLARQSYPAFCEAVTANHRDQVEFLLSKGLKINEPPKGQYNISPLSGAVRSGNIEMIRYLF